MLKTLRSWLLAAALLAAPSLAAAQATSTPLVVTDSNGVKQSTCAYTEGGVLYPCHFVYGVDGSGDLHGLITDNTGHLIVNLNAGSITTPPDALTTGTVSSAVANAAFTVNLANGEAVTNFKVSGLTASGATLTLEGSNDGGVTWTAIAELANGSSAPVSTLTADGQFGVNTGGRTNVRLRVSSTGTGTVTFAANASSASSRVTIQAAPFLAQASNQQTPETHAQCAALCTSLVVKASPGTLYGFNIGADSTLDAAAWWVLVYDATSKPSDGSVTPAKCYPMPLGATGINGAFATGGVAFTTGIVIAVSTNGCFTSASSTHAFISADYQ